MTQSSIIWGETELNMVGVIVEGDPVVMILVYSNDNTLYHLYTVNSFGREGLSRSPPSDEWPY